jgi:hypothetical protein
MLDWLLPSASIFAEMKLHGNTRWVPKALVCLALLWACSESKCLTVAYTEAARSCKSMYGQCALNTYQGFMGALVRWTPMLLKILWPVVHERMQAIGGRFWQVDGWVPIAFDGSRCTAPRTRANEQALCAPNYGHGKTAQYRKKKTKGLRRKRNEQQPSQPQAPQAWITLLWHMRLRLPWTWRLGPSNSSERAHVAELLSAGKFPKNTLFCGDAGFIGYLLWSQLITCGDFLVRVGGNVHLLSEHLDVHEQDGLVWCWPKGLQGTHPPLRLRLVQVRIGRSKTKVHLLTSVLDPQALTIPQMVKFYQMRWGIEVEFRGLKQTLDRANLRCRNDRRLLAELDWSLMAMAVVELFALKEQLAAREQKRRSRPPAPDPARRSLAASLRAVRDCLCRPNEVPEPGQDLGSALRAAVTDGYERHRPKGARYRPPNPDKKPLGAPVIRPLTPEEAQRLQNFTLKKAA